MTQPAGEFSLQVERESGFVFRVHFDKPQFRDLVVDEPPPLGKDEGPNASRLLAAAVGNCLSASLLFCLRKAGLEPDSLRGDVLVHLARNDANRLRIGRVDVTLRPSVPQDAPALEQCLRTFEDFCVVTQSVREGLDVRVNVEPTVSPAGPAAG